MRRYPMLLLCALFLAGCGMIYTNIRTPWLYRSATPAEVKSSPNDETVHGEACSRSLLFLFAWGDSGYAAATKKALTDKPDFILYDVKSDVKVTSALLGLYTRVCTVITGKAAHS